MAKDVQKARTSGNGIDSGNGHASLNGKIEDASILASDNAAVSGAEIELMRPKRSKLRIIVPVLLLAIAAVVVGWVLLQPAKGPNTVTVTRGSIISTVETTGKLEAETSAQLSFKPAGRVEQVFVKQGDTVQKGQVLAELETEDLERNVNEAEVQLEISKLKYQQSQQGAREEDIVAATADLNAATARLNNVKAGSRSEDIAVAQAGVNQAQAKLDAVKKGPTPEDVTVAEATLRQAQARLEAAKQPASPEQIAGAEAGVREAQAKLDSLKKGASEEDIAVAQAALDQANANLDLAKKGPSAEDVAAAKAKLDEAKAAREQVAATTSNAKEQARLDVVQASNALQNVQDVYGKIKDENDQTKPADLTNDDKNREAKALRDVKDAEAKVEQASLNYDTAKKNEISQLAQADSNIKGAQAAYDKAAAGPSAEDVAIAQSGVDSAKAKLDSVMAPPKVEDVAAAQAGVDQAQSNLDHLKAGGTANEIAEAQADVDKAQASLDAVKKGPSAEDIRVAQEELAQANANLDKVKAGATAADIQEAQAQVDAAQASLDKLRAGPTSTDLKILEQGIVLSQIAVDGANSDLDNAKLITPIGGTVLAINLEVGETVGGFQQVASVADVNSLRVKADIDELDIGRVSVGQAVTVTLDAYPGVKLPGKIDKLAPGATQKQGSTVYQATISFGKSEGVVPREGMAASVDVTAQRKDGVLLIPNRAIETIGDREYVTIPQGNTTRKVEIEAGLSNNTDTEVISGLNEGQAVVVR